MQQDDPETAVQSTMKRRHFLSALAIGAAGLSAAAITTLTGCSEESVATHGLTLDTFGLIAQVTLGNATASQVQGPLGFANVTAPNVTNCTMALNGHVTMTLTIIPTGNENQYLVGVQGENNYYSVNVAPLDGGAQKHPAGLTQRTGQDLPFDQLVIQFVPNPQLNSFVVEVVSDNDGDLSAPTFIQVNISQLICTILSSSSSSSSFSSSSSSITGISDV